MAEEDKVLEGVVETVAEQDKVLEGVVETVAEQAQAVEDLAAQRSDATVDLLRHLVNFLSAAYMSETCCGFQINVGYVPMGEVNEPARFVITVCDNLGGIVAPRAG